jgi:hypothetical protein
MFKAMEKREHIPENEIGFKVEIPRKEGRDDLLSRVTALFLNGCYSCLLEVRAQRSNSGITSIVADLFIGYGALAERSAADKFAFFLERKYRVHRSPCSAETLWSGKRFVIPFLFYLYFYHVRVSTPRISTTFTIALYLPLFS